MVIIYNSKYEKKQVMIGHSLVMYHSVLLTNMGLNMNKGAFFAKRPLTNINVTHHKCCLYAMI